MIELIKTSPQLAIEYSKVFGNCDRAALNSVALAWANLTPVPEPSRETLGTHRSQSMSLAMAAEVFAPPVPTAAWGWSFSSRNIVTPRDARREARKRGGALLSLDEAESILQLGALYPGENVWALVEKDSETCDPDKWIQVWHGMSTIDCRVQ